MTTKSGPATSGRRRHRRLRILATIAATALALCACGTVAATSPADGGDTAPPKPAKAVPPDIAAAQAKLYEDAKREGGTVTFYSTAVEATNKDFAVEFAKAYPEGPKLNVVTLSGALFATRYGSEREAGNVAADLLYIDLLALRSFSQRGWIQQPSPETIPSSALYPDEYTYPYGVINGIYPQIILYNTAAGPAPTGLGDLLDPRYRGKIGIADPRQQPQNLSAMAVIQKQFGDEGLRKLAANEPVYYASANPGVAALSSGEISVFFAGYAPNHTAATKAGAPVGRVTPDAFSGALNAVAISEGTRHQAGAQLVADFALSNAGQAIFNGNGNGSSALPDAGDFQGTKTYSAPAPIPSGFQVYSLEQLDSLKPTILADLGLQ